MADFTLLLNPRHGVPGIVTLPAGGFRRAKAEITSWDGYAPTPPLDLPMPGTVRLKDESHRFGLGSFKALGGAYAVANLLADALARLGFARAGRWPLRGGHQPHHRHLRHRRQPRPRRCLGRRAVSLPLRDLPPRDGQRRRT